MTGLSFGGGGFSIGDYPLSEVQQGELAQASSVTLTNAVIADIVALPYTAGEWIVVTNITMSYVVATVTEMQTFVGTTVGNSSTGITVDNTAYIGHGASGSSSLASRGVFSKFTATTSGTLYLKAKATFSAGGVTAFGSLAMYRRT